MKKVFFALLLGVMVINFPARMFASGIDYSTDPRFTAPDNPGDSGGSGNNGGSNGNTGGQPQYPTGGPPQVSGGGDSTPEVDEETVAIENEMKEIKTEVNGLESSLNRIPDSGDGDVDASDIILNVSNAIEAGTEAAEYARAETDTNVDNVVSAEKQVSELKVGDPVSIVSGEYFLEDSDVKNVTRYYASQCNITGSFGFGWYSNLDEVILIGIEDYSTNPKTLYDRNCTTVVNDAITECRNRILSEYNVSDIESGEEGIRDTLSSLKKLKTKFETKLSKVNALVTRAEGRSIKSSVTSLQSRIQGLIKSCNKEISNYEYLLSNFIRDVSDLETLKSYYAIALQESERYGSLYDESLANAEKNILAKKSGMAESYYKTGRETLVYVDGKGVPHLFEKKGNNKFVPYLESQYELVSITMLNNNGYELYFKSGLKKVFDSNGLIIKIIDRTGYTVSINRNQSGKISKLSTTFGENYIFSYAGDFISEIKKERNPDFRITYTYTNITMLFLRRTCLASVTDEEGDEVCFSYSSTGKLEEINKNDGSSIKIHYNEQSIFVKNLVTATVNEQGFSERFEYKKMTREARYTDHDGNESIYSYDSDFRTIYSKTSDGCETYFYYDDKGNCIKEKINGCVIDYSYDSYGNKVRANYSDGSFESWRYDEFSLPIEYHDRDGVTSIFERDEKGNQISYKHGGKIVWTAEYDSKGLIKKRTVYGGTQITTAFSYDGFGNLVEKKIGDRTEKYSYDIDDRIKKVTVNDKKISSYEYENKKITKIDYNGKKTVYVWNGRKDLIRIEEIDTHTGEKRITRYEYDNRHLPLKKYFGRQEKQSIVWEGRYTCSGKPKAEMTIDGDVCYVTVYSYSGNEISQITRFKLNNTISDFQSIELDELQDSADDAYIKKYEKQIGYNNFITMTLTDEIGRIQVLKYDSFGNNYEYKNPLLETFSTNFSAGGKITSTETEYGGFYDFNYDSQGCLSKAGERNKTKVSMTYNNDGSASSSTNRYGERTNYSYNIYGKLSCISSPAKKVWYSYDVFGRLTQLVVGQENNLSTAERYVLYKYSDDDRIIEITDGGLYKSIYEVNVFGEILKRTDGNNNQAIFEYDEYGNQTTVTDSYGNKSSFEYNCFGFPTKTIDFDGSVKSYYYDSDLNLVKVTDALGIVWQGSYDKVGRLISEKGRPGINKSYEYDELDRLKLVKVGGVVTESYSYSSYGREITFTDGNGNNYRYFKDDFGRVVSEINREGIGQNFAFDVEGALKLKKDFNGNETRIEYKNGSTKVMQSFFDGTNSALTYDMSGNIVSAVNECAEIIYQYDKAGKLISLKDETGGSYLRYEYDNAGNRIRLVSNNSDVTYVYGRNNELLSVSDNKQRISVEFSYDKCGREISRKFGNGVEQSTSYDEAGNIVLLSEKDGNRNLVRAEGYVYDSEGRQIAKVTNSGSVTLFEYDSFGHVKKVCYPISKELESFQKKEAAENGIPTEGISIGESRYLSSSLYNKLNSLYLRMGGAITSVTPMQAFNVESYEYDRCNNRIAKTTSYGIIEYRYSAENRLVSSGAKGREHSVFYTYDLNGNLLEKRNAYGKSEYTYNAVNRMSQSQVVDNLKKTVSRLSYEYDVFGRRTVVQDSMTSASRLLYDGFSFDVVKKSPVHPNGMAVDLFSDTFQYVASEEVSMPVADRYYYIDDDSSLVKKSVSDGSRYEFISGYDISEQVYIYGNGSPIAVSQLNDSVSRSRGSYYYGTDLYGSVRSQTDSYGKAIGNYDYDLFGNWLCDNEYNMSDAHGVSYGYCGKSYNSVTGLLDYGYRDYDASVGRFTTVDPIRDGVNWFGYCGGDSVNWMDRWGLELILTVDKESQMMKVQLELPNYHCERDFFVTTAVVSGNPTQVTNMDPEKKNGNGSQWTQFPEGTWKLTGTGTATQPKKEKDPYFGETWITTEATQVLPDGNGGEVVDGGYYIHLTTCSNTAGCVGLKYEDNGKSNMDFLLFLYNYNELKDPGSGKIVIKGEPTKANKDKISNRNKHKQKQWSYKEWKAAQDEKDEIRAESKKRNQEILELVEKRNAGKTK